MVIIHSEVSSSTKMLWCMQTPKWLTLRFKKTLLTIPYLSHTKMEERFPHSLTMRLLHLQIVFGRIISVKQETSQCSWPLIWKLLLLLQLSLPIIATYTRYLSLQHSIWKKYSMTLNIKKASSWSVTQNSMKWILPRT